MEINRVDAKHIAFHVLVGLYFIWVVVFGTLIVMALINTFGNANATLAKIFIGWILLNLVMGSVLFIVIRLFKNKSLLNRIIVYSYCFMVAASLGALLAETLV